MSTYSLIIELPKNTGSFCFSILTIYTNDWSTFWHVYCWHGYFFSAKFLNTWKPRKTFYLLWWASPPWYNICGTGLTYLLSWWGWWMQVGSVPYNQKFSCKYHLSFFEAAPLNRLPFYFGRSLHIISSLLSHFHLL